MEAVVYRLHPGTDAHLELEGNDAGLCEIKKVLANGFLSGGVQVKLESILCLNIQVKLQIRSTNGRLFRLFLQRKRRDLA